MVGRQRPVLTLSRWCAVAVPDLMRVAFGGVHLIVGSAPMGTSLRVLMKSDFAGITALLLENNSTASPLANRTYPCSIDCLHYG